MAMSDVYPPQMLRGIRNEEWVSENPPYRSAFFFDDDDQREDGFRELSVVWYYNANSLESIRSITYRKKSIFTGGIAVIEKDTLDRVIREHDLPVRYELRPSKKMPHHGNILIKKGSSIMERRAAAYIARHAKFYPLDSEIPCLNDTMHVPEPR